MLSEAPGSRDAQQAIWALIAQGLAYVDATQPASGNWVVRLSTNGWLAVEDEEYSPNDPTGYMSRLESAIPGLSEVVRGYVREALFAYNSQLYLASTVMIGVASEAAFIEMAGAFASTLQGESKDQFAAVISGKTNYVHKFSEFRKRIESRKHELADEFADGMSLLLDSVLDLLRVNRNDAGHPTGKQFGRDDCFTALQMAGRYLKRLSGLMEHFEGSVGATAT